MNFLASSIGSRCNLEKSMQGGLGMGQLICQFSDRDRGVTCETYNDNDLINQVIY